MVKLLTREKPADFALISKLAVEQGWTFVLLWFLFLELHLNENAEQT